MNHKIQVELLVAHSLTPEIRQTYKFMGKFSGHLYPGLYLLFYGLNQVTVFKATIVSDSPLCPSCPPSNKEQWATLWKISYGSLLKVRTGSILVAYEISGMKAVWF
ncbi:hypothetical protein MC885_015323 [Smutsia gigantea]|nr:hypothetical protein MC885_015323 [Smutsia gigantea]